MTDISRACAGALFGGALVLLLSACSFSWTARGAGGASASAGASSANTPASSTSTSSTSASSTSASSTWTSSTSTSDPGGSNTVSIASCSGDSCSVTLGGEGARVRVLGTNISFSGIRDGQATVRVGDRDVSLTEGATASVDRLVLRCTRVTQDTVTMEASLE